MKLAFKTFGCRANSVDTDILYFEARRRGFDVVDETESADAYVINSCTVTSHADRDARNQARRFKRQNPKALVGVVGCYAQVASEEVADLDDVDFVVGTAEKQRIFELFQKADQEVCPNHVASTEGFLPEQFLGSLRSRASIKIQDGCNFSCSYCIIPQARGRSRSLPMDTVVNQIAQAEAMGFREVVLTGIHLANYGWDQNTDLETLLREIFRQKEGRARIRLSTLDPFEIPEGILSLLKNEERLCPYFHIALQSGDDGILKAMRRLYQAHEFVGITQAIKKTRPETYIGADVIVGFPGETEAAFEETLRCLAVSPWTKLHVFPFSTRPGTAAANLDPDSKVNSAEIQERSQRLRQLSDKRLKAFYQSELGQEREVLFEKPSKHYPGLWQGHTENYLPTLTPQSTEPRTKQIRTCVIKSIKNEWILTG